MREALANDIALVIRITKRARGLALKGVAALHKCTPTKRQLVRQMREESGREKCCDARWKKQKKTKDGRSKRKRLRTRRSGRAREGAKEDGVRPLCREIFIHGCSHVVFFYFFLFFSRLRPTSTSPRCRRGFSSRRRGRGGEGGVEKRSEQKRVKLV